MTKNRPVVAVVAFVLAAAAYWFLILSDKRDEVAKLKTEVETAKTELANARQLEQQYLAAKSGYKQAYTSVVRLGKAVPADDDVRSLVVQLDGAATSSKVDFESINVGGGGATENSTANAGAASLPPGAVVGPAGFPTVPFDFSFNGKFFRLSDFFRRLEGFVEIRNRNVDVTGRLLTIDSISLTPAADGFPNINAKVGATSFLVPPTQGLTGGATANGPAATTAASGGSAAGAPSTTTPTTTGAIR